MFVHNILRKRGTYVPTIDPDAPIIEALEALQFESVGALIASRDNGLTALGLVLEKDIVRALYDCGKEVFDLTVADLMSAPIVTCRPTDAIASVMSLMWRHNIHHVPVLDRGRLAGIVSYHDILDHRYGSSTAGPVTTEKVQALRPGYGRPSLLRH